MFVVRLVCERGTVFGALSDPDVNRNTAGSSGSCLGSPRRIAPEFRIVPRSVESCSAFPIPSRIVSRYSYGVPGTSMPSRSTSFFEVMIRCVPVTLTP